MSNFIRSCKCGKNHMARSPKIAIHAEVYKAALKAWGVNKIAELKANPACTALEVSYYSEDPMALLRGSEADNIGEAACAQFEKNQKMKKGGN